MRSTDLDIIVGFSSSTIVSSLSSSSGSVGKFSMSVTFSISAYGCLTELRSGHSENIKLVD